MLPGPISSLIIHDTVPITIFYHAHTKRMV
jgi:hypothetical protein